MTEQERLEQEIIELLTDSPSELRSALHWMLKNQATVTELCKGKAIPADEMETMIEEAKKKKDYFSALLLAHKRLYDQENGK